ncbi:MAG: cupin domain-containing protein [Thermodesulfobacteriota bacterium]
MKRVSFREEKEKMGFWDLKTLKLDEFRPGIRSKLESGSNLTMAFMEIAPNKDGTAHDHPFDQCGVVIEGEIEMSVGEEKKLLKPMETYFIPTGVKHNWKTMFSAAKILDIVVKQG